MNLDKRVVIITGASEGIGAALVKECTQKNAFVVLVSRNKKALIELSSQIHPKNTLVVAADLSTISDIDRLVQTVSRELGRIDILINNAGIGYISSVENITYHDFTKVLSINLFGALQTMQRVIPLMRLNGGGLIVNVSSMITRIATAFSGGYRASKMALDAISDAARIELKKDNIRIMTVYPGLTSTNFFQHSIGASYNSVTAPRGKSAEFVAKKIVSAVQKEPARLFMGIEAYFRGVFGQLFPLTAEKFIAVKQKSGSNQSH